MRELDPSETLVIAGGLPEGHRLTVGASDGELRFQVSAPAD